MEDTSATGQLHNLLDSLASPLGMIALLLLAVGIVLAISCKPVRWWTLAVMLWASTLGFFYAEKFDNHLIFPLEQIRSQGRGLTGGMLLMLLIPSLLANKGWRPRPISVAVVLFFLFESMFSVRDMLQGDFSRGGFGEIVFFLTFIALGVGLPRWLQTMQNITTTIWYVGIAATLFCLGTFAQTVINRSAVIYSSRLMGTTGNAQHAAVVLAASIPPVCYLVSQRNQKAFWRLCFGATAGLLAIFLLWTGSRTGLLMTLVSLLIMFRRSLGRLVLLAGVVMIFVIIGMMVYTDVPVVNEHLWSTSDSRSDVWQSQISAFESNPVFGNTDLSASGIGVSENSYLVTAARYGIVGLIPLLAMMACTAFGIVRLYGLRRQLADYPLLVDMVIGSLIALAIGAWFEGYLIGTLSFPVYCVYIELALLHALTDFAVAGVPNHSYAASGADAYAYRQMFEPY